MNNLTNQQKGSLMAFVAIMLITPDSLLIRLSNIETWGMLFYRGAIPFVVVLIGLILFYKNKFFSNGILGGNTAMAAEMSYAIKFQKLNKIVCLFIGDGTLGQGIFYETLNLIGKKGSCHQVHCYFMLL